MTSPARLILPVLLPAATAVAAQLAGLTSLLGAHPWWAGQVLWVGTVAGIALAGAARLSGLRQRLRVPGFALLALAAFALAHIGKTRFAASYAEDALAGQMWHLGWIAVCAMVAAALASAVWPDRIVRG